MPPVSHMLSRYVPALRPYCTLAGQCDPVSNIKIESKFVLTENCLQYDLNATGFENKDVAEKMTSDTGYIKMKICSEGNYVLNCWVNTRI